MEKPKVSRTSITQSIDLEELTGLDLRGFRGLRESIGQAILDKINARTASGIGYGSTKLKSPYSKPYQKSLQFKAAGKGASRVDMRLTGDMLETMDVLTSGDDSSVRISIASDQTDKAFNHLTGDTVPKRNFFGVTKKEVNSILAEFKDDLDAVRGDDSRVTDQSPRRKTIQDLLDDLNNEDGNEG